MDYTAYYKLGLKETFGGDFPPMPSEEFDSLCRVPHVPEALKACYLVLGRSRICMMQLILVPVHELCVVGKMLVFARLDEERCCALREEDLNEENPLIYCLTDVTEDKENKTITNHFITDGDLRLARMLTQLMERTYEGVIWRMGAPLRSRFQWWRDSLMQTRGTLRAGYIFSAFWIFMMTAGGLGRFLMWYSASPFFDALWLLATLAGMGAVLTLFCGFIRFWLYYNIWLDWNDNVRFAAFNAPEVELLRELAMTFFRWNQPDLWNSEGGGLYLDCSIALRNGSYRYVQGRYDFIPFRDGTLSVPGFPGIPFKTGTAQTVLFRVTYDSCGCLMFTHVFPGRRRKLPVPRKAIL